MRLHIIIWREFKLRTGKWPRISIALFLCRFAFVAAELVVVTHFLIEHNSRTSDVRGTTSSVFFAIISAIVFQVALTVEQAGRYFFIAFAIVISVSVYFKYGSHATLLGTAAVGALAFAAIWGLVERVWWNRQLQKSRLALAHDVWDLTQFPQRSD